MNDMAYQFGGSTPLYKTEPGSQNGPEKFEREWIREALHLYRDLLIRKANLMSRTIIGGTAQAEEMRNKARRIDELSRRY